MVSFALLLKPSTIPAEISPFAQDGCMARSEKNVPLLFEQFSNAASKENATH
jgi:hypothetical protein